MAAEVVVRFEARGAAESAALGHLESGVPARSAPVWRQVGLVGGESGDRERPADEELEFHISPVLSSSRPHAGVGTCGIASSSLRAVWGSFVSRSGLPMA